jgi:hypothetical protein
VEILFFKGHLGGCLIALFKKDWNEKQELPLLKMPEPFASK